MTEDSIANTDQTFEVMTPDRGLLKLLEVNFSYRADSAAFLLVKDEDEARAKITESMKDAPEFTIQAIKTSSKSMEELDEMNRQRQQAQINNFIQALAGNAEEISEQELNDGLADVSPPTKSIN